MFIFYSRLWVCGFLFYYSSYVSDYFQFIKNKSEECSLKVIKGGKVALIKYHLE